MRTITAIKVENNHATKQRVVLLLDRVPVEQADIDRGVGIWTLGKPIEVPDDLEGLRFDAPPFCVMTLIEKPNVDELQRQMEQAKVST